MTNVIDYSAYFTELTIDNQEERMIAQELGEVFGIGKSAVEEDLEIYEFNDDSMVGFHIVLDDEALEALTDD